MLRPGKPHAGALRRGHFSESGRVYLLTAVLHDREALLQDFALGRLWSPSCAMLTRMDWRTQWLGW